MQKFSFIVTNKTIDWREVVLFGTADDLRKKMTLSGANAEIICTPSYDEAIRVWNDLSTLVSIKANILNPEAMTTGQYKEYEHRLDNDHYCAYKIRTEDVNGASVELPVGRQNKTSGNPLKIEKQNHGKGLARTDTATCLFFLLPPEISVNIEIELKPLKTY